MVTIVFEIRQTLYIFVKKISFRDFISNKIVHSLPYPKPAEIKRMEWYFGDLLRSFGKLNRSTDNANP